MNNSTMDEKETPSKSRKAELSPVISVRASPADVGVSLSSTYTDAATIAIEFTLQGSKPVTIFTFDNLLQPPPSGPSIIHRTFSFTDTISGATYKPPIADCCRIHNCNDYILSYKNEENFLTLYPNTPYVVDRKLWPKPDDGNSRADPHNMEPGRSYRMTLHEPGEKQHLWWMWGRKWQILRWRWWPFGEIKDISDFVCGGHKKWDELPEARFVWEGDCIVHVAA